MKKHSGYSTEELVNAIRSTIGINEAIQYLYTQHYKYLENYVLRNSGNEDDAADIIQESFLVFIKMVESDKFRQEAAIKSYLYSITKNLWITELRKRKSMAARQEVYSKQMDDLEVDVTLTIVQNESHHLILDLFSELGEKCKQILYNFYYENLSMKEILKLQNFSNEQVLRNKKHKCLKGLIEKIHSDPKVYTTIKNALQYVK
ncbi:RNA polymerase sigma factor [Mongoliitalea daihaiensis]|uniref:RNA polymerase sigma factor n=1 Tax=Mongoliitalea daihaiensis TaxID=2782006 RepID=UPI001F2C81A2|nr:sigma-70 family RNA polymerase sigma factor [Mongoliitalea daihaiensis]UJP64362.1 sigma-70 family RNA polymerase sigma factor [Mongoliitalea daihaiensis]